MTYKRQIAYFDYIEDGQKKGSKGFCKWEQRNGCHILSIVLSGLPDGISETVGVYTKAGGVLGELNLQNGREEALFRLVEDGHDWCRELERIRIPLSQGRELEAEFPVGEGGLAEDGFGAGEKNLNEVGLTEEAELTEKQVLKTEEALEIENMPLLSLWECLAQTHEIIHPFGTEIEYYRIALEDIFLLKERYHVLQKNLFLLHGYYNYKYFILGKKDESCQEYWLGVPGIYHEREKMAARMYGFEKFEGAKPKYRVGDLGYYLITVQ